MSVDAPARPFYIDAGGEPVFAFHHPGAGGTGVLLAPPFGWDDICSYRSRRALAMRLAADGHHVLRFDLPGCGDSGGSPADPGRLEAWTAAVEAAARWLRSEAGCTTLVACGIGLGGLVAWRAAAQGAPIDQLVLWATPARGRTFLRELRVFARMEAEQFAAAGADPPEHSPGVIHVGGFALRDETIAALEALDLTELPLPASIERVLLLERDGIAVDARLREHLESTGIEHVVAPGPGYAEMLAEPHEARTPVETIEQIANWIGPAARTGPQAAPDAQPGGEAVARVGAGDQEVRERPIAVEQPFGRLFGVVTEPLETQAGLTAVFLNSGAIRRIGPGRLWVEAARRWAARGVPAVRLDLEGIGDADGDGERFSKVIEFYTPDMVRQVQAALDVLDARGLGPDYVLAGLCSGSYWAFHTAAMDDRVRAAVMINPRILTWDTYRLTKREAKRAAKVRDPAKVREVLRGEKPLSLVLSIALALASMALLAPLRAARSALAGVRARRAGGDDVDRAFDRLQAGGKHAVLVFSGQEPLHAEMEQEGRLDRIAARPNVSLELLGFPDHTLRPPALQARAGEVIDAALERQLRLTRSA
jgi:pimeloyl-ACP methyl ester carboxylesterase